MEADVAFAKDQGDFSSSHIEEFDYFLVGGATAMKLENPGTEVVVYETKELYGEGEGINYEHTFVEKKAEGLDEFKRLGKRLGSQNILESKEEQIEALSEFYR